MPLYSDGGYFTMGVGGHPAGGPWTMFVGLSAGGPYDGAGLALGRAAWDARGCARFPRCHSSRALDLPRSSSPR